MNVLALVGPTASGKSSLALRVARARDDAARRPVEIVAVDAFTIYRGMDVGTAKPSAAERAEVPHHLVDVLPPRRQVDVAWFQEQARTAVADVHARDRVPLLVGGSGLYFRAVVDDLRFPPTDLELRATIESRVTADPDAARAELAAVDPAAAARIDPRNLRRVVRALEVVELTGEPFSSFSDAWSTYDSVYDGLDVALLDPPTAVLRRRIDARAQAMVAGGLVEETAGLGPLSRTAAQAIGYAEAAAVLAGDLDLHDLAPRIATRTMRYARRQRSWFRADPRARTVTAEQLLRRWAHAPDVR